MAKLNGFGGSMKIGANSVAELEEWSTNEDSSLFTGTAKGESSVQGAAGPVTRTLSVTVFTDPSNTTGQGAMTVGATVSSLELYFDGETSGDYYMSCSSAVVQSVGVTDPMDYSKTTYQLHLNAALVQETVA